MFHFLVLQFYLKNGQEKKIKWQRSEKNAEEKQNSATTMTSVDGKQTVFPKKSWNYKGNRFKTHIKKEDFKKGLINLIETIHQINMTSDNFVSSKNSFKSHLNAKGFNTFLTV